MASASAPISIKFGRDFPKVNYYIGFRIQVEKNANNMSIGYHIIDIKALNSYIFTYEPYITEVSVPDDFPIKTYKDKWNNTASDFCIILYKII
jgi:tRNA uridine 5-carbamoylmethylation protein Kti12